MADDRIYESLNPSDGSQWNGSAMNGSKLLVRSRTAPQRSLSTGDSYYSVPKMANATPPLPRTQPPSIPPRNRNYSEGEGFRSSSFESSPSDRGGFFPGRKTPLGISKSPSVHSVNSTHSSTTGVEELLLSNFLSRYAKSLPLRVKVCKGFYGVSDSTAVTTGEMLNLHFVKNTKVVVIEVSDPDHGTIKFSVPLNSSVRFSPLYDPRNNLDEAKRGFRFDTAGDILSAKVMPKVVRATKSYTGSSSDSSVAENEILVVKNSKSKLTGKQLRVFSLSTKRKKTLSENCAGHFTTNPTQLHLPLCDLTTSMGDTFPVKALLMVGRDGLDTILTDLQGEIVTMTKVLTEQSVIATNYSDDSDDCSDELEVAEMPFDLDIEVEALALEDHEIDMLRADTGQMYETFDPYSVRIYQTKPTSRLYEIQCQLYKTTTGVNDFRGLEVVKPLSITKQVKKSSTGSVHSGSAPPPASNPPQVYQPLNIDFDEKKCTDYYVVMTPKRAASNNPNPNTPHQPDESDLGQRSNVALLEQQHRNMDSNMNKMMEEITRLKSKTEHLTRRCDSLQAQLRMVNSAGRNRDVSECSSLSGSPPSMDSRPPAPLPKDARDRLRSPTPVEEPGMYHLIGDQDMRSSSPCRSRLHLSNEEFLSAMNHQQVLNLLDVMGMRQYHDKFKQEQVNGEILAECDEQVLADDLGVTSKLHRMRLMKIVTGRHSAKCILAGEDPYPKKKATPQLVESGSE